MTGLFVLALLTACSRDPNVRKQKYAESGDRYFAAGKYKEAAIQYRNAVQIDPRFGDAHYKLAQCYLKEGNLTGAYQELMRTVDLQPTDLKARIDLGNLLLGARDPQAFKRAQDQATAVLQQDPNNAAGHILMANSDAMLQDVGESLKEMQTAIELAPADSRSYINLAMLELNAKQAEAAEQNFQKAIQLDPKSLTARLALGNFYASQRRFADAEQQFSSAVQMEPKGPVAYAALAKLYLIENQRPKAEQILQQAKQAMPDSPEGYRMLGDFYFSIGDSQDAINEYSTLTAQHPKDLRVRKNYIQLLILAMRLPEAEKLNDALLKENPKDVDGLIYKGQLLSAQGKPNDATQPLEIALKSAPENPMAHYTLAIAMMQLGNTERAQSELQEAVKINPGMVQAQKTLAQLALRKKDFDRARQSAEALMKIEPRSADGYLLRAEALLGKGDSLAADLALQQTIQMAPNDARGYASLANLRAAEKKYPEAEKYFQLALSKDPRSAQALTGLVKLRLLDKQPGKAMALVQEQIAKVPDDSAFYQLLGQLQASEKDLTAAKQSLEKATQVDPNNSDAVLQLAQIQVVTGAAEQGIATYQQAIQKNPRDVRAYLLLGMLQESQGNWQAAQPNYQKVLDIQSDNPLAANNLAYSMLDHGGNVDVALSLAQTARRGLPDSASTEDTLAWAYIQKENYQQAADMLEDALKKTPQDQAIEYHLGVAYQKLNDSGRAKLHLQHALQLNPTSSLADTIRKALTDNALG